MFSKAYEIASTYTQPLLVSSRLFNGEIKNNLGSFVIINDEGWIITVAHMLDSLIAFNQNNKEIQDKTRISLNLPFLKSLIKKKPRLL